MEFYDAKKRRRELSDGSDLDMHVDSDGSEPSSHADDTPGSAPLELPLGMSTDEDIPDEEESDEEDAKSAHGIGTRNRREYGDEEETPSTSPSALDRLNDELPLGEVSGNVRLGKNGVTGRSVVLEDYDEDEDDMPVTKPVPQRRNVRVGFTIDDDSE